MARVIRRAWWVGLLVLMSLMLPFVVTNEYYMQVIIMGYIWAIAVYGLNIILGYSGQLSLGHAGFFGIGAYTVALLSLKLGVSFWMGILVAAVLSVAVGFLVGIVSLRMKGHYFAIFTMAVGVIINLVLDKWNALTNGEVGLINIPAPSPIGPLKFDSTIPNYFLVLGFLFISIYVSYALKHSILGRRLAAIRNSEELAQAIGVPVMKNKRVAFMLSTAFAGVAGGLYATYLGYLGPDVSSIDTTFNMLLYLLVGGIGSISGPLIGSLLVAVLTQFLQVLQDYQMIIFGPVLVLLIIFFPGGLAAVSRVFGRLKGPASTVRRASAFVEAEDAAGGVSEGGR